MTTFTAYFDCTLVRAMFDFTAETPEQALELARAKYNEDYYDLEFRPYDADYPPIQEIAIRDANSEPTGVCWQSPDYRLREAAPKLLAALRNLLGDLPPVQGGICHCCGRDYRGEDPVPDGECPADDCPATIARAAIAEAEGATRQPAAP